MNRGELGEIPLAENNEPRMIRIRRWLQLRFGERGEGDNYDLTSIRPPFDSHSTAVRLRYDHSTTYFTTAGTAALWTK